MSNNFDKGALARKNVRVVGAVILGCATLLSVVSSYRLTVDAWKDTGETLAKVLGFINVLTIEAVFLWLIFGFKKAFSSGLEKTLAITGILFYGCVMGVNILIHYRTVKGFVLNDFEQAWMSWGIAVVVLTTIGLATAISMADPDSRAMRQQLRVQGKQQDMIWTAKELMLDSDYVEQAVEARAEIDARDFVERLLGDGSDRSLGSGGSTMRPSFQRANFRRPVRKPDPKA